jgi:hypothetical protein
MKKLILAAALALGTLVPAVSVTTPAFAQGAIDASSNAMTPDMMVQIRAYAQRSTSPLATIPGTVAIGNNLPAAVELRSFPATMNASAVRYVRTSNGLVVVDARTRRVLEIVR